MKHISSLKLLVLLTYSCDNGTKNQKIDATSDTIVVSEKIVPVDNTSYHFPDISLPMNFYKESIKVVDTCGGESKYYASLYLSSSNKFKEYNQLLFSTINSMISKEIEYFKSEYKPGNPDILYSFDMNAIDFFANKNVISITYVIDTYTEGAAHHNHSWYTFNYDIKKKKTIRFSDIFNLKTKLDKENFVAFADRNEVDHCSENWSLHSDSINFAFTHKGIYIYPDLLWECGDYKSLLPKDSLARKIQEILRD